MILIIDTSSKKSLVIKASEKNFQKRVFEADFCHSEKLLPEIAKLFSGDSFKKIKGISVISGPGSYTGLRVGIATANTLSYGLDVPVSAINKLEWLACSSLKFLEKQKKVQICAIVFATANQIFAGVYDFKKERKLEQKGDFFSGSIDELLRLIKKPALFIVEKDIALRGIISKEILKNKARDNFFDIDFGDFLSKKLIDILINLSLEKLSKTKKNNIIRPLYIRQPNITYPQRKKL